jgi:hypothetical protein
MLIRVAPRLWSLALLFALGAAGSLLAVEPQLGNLTPDGYTRGQEVEMTFSGARLGDAKGILFYSPGLQLSGITPVNENSFKAKVAIAADCRMGLHALRVQTASGVSNLKMFSVGNLPIVDEKEPNTEFTKPQEVPLNVTIHGVVQAEDQDFFLVEAKKGQRITAEVEGLRLGNAFFDPYLAILNSARFELDRSDDAALLNQDCVCSIVAPEDGKYYIQIRETAFGGNGNCTYRLHVGTFPRPEAAYPAGGKPGEALQVKWLGDAAGEFVTNVTLPSDEHHEAGLFAQQGDQLAPSPNVFRISDLTNHLEVEPNEAIAQASSGTAPGALNGIIQQPGDSDYFRFQAKKGQQLDIRVYARKPLRSPLDSVLSIHNDKGGQVAANDDSGGPDSYLRFSAPADGEYFAAIRDHLGKGGPTYVYRIEISEVKPDLTMLLPERQQYISTTLTIPKNNRMALMVNATRTNFGGDLAVAFQGLPAGIVVEAKAMLAAEASIPVLFTAAADAPPAGALVDIVGKPADPNLQQVAGHLKQRSMLVRGQNNTDVWGHDADRMAVSLSEEIPFRIEVVPPKAPLVRNGSLGLKVVATRAPDFKAPISVLLLYNPGGVSSSGSVQIPEGQNEAVIPLTAAGNAALATSKIVVIGRAAHQGATVECSSQLVDLTVADQFFKFDFDKAACEQGQNTEVAIKVEKLRDFAGPVQAELKGLPSGATTEPVQFDQNTAEIVFKVVVAKDAKPGKSTSLVCVTTQQVEGDAVTHTLGNGELRIDVPLPPKANAPAATAQAPQPAPAGQPMKRLSRLEQLRLEKEGKK